MNNRILTKAPRAASTSQPALLLSIAIALGLALGAGQAGAQARPPTAAPVAIDIAPQPLGDALLQWAAQTRVRVFYPPEAVAGIASPGLRATLAPEDALRALLKGTGVSYRRQGRQHHPGA